jgi:hypothetical protein
MAGVLGHVSIMHMVAEPLADAAERYLEETP